MGIPVARAAVACSYQPSWGYFRFRASSTNRVASSLVACSRWISLLRALPSVFPHSPCRLVRPRLLSLLRFRSPSGLTPEGLTQHLSMRAPLELACRSTHPFRGNPHKPWTSTSRLRSAFRISHPLRGFRLPRPCRFISPRKRPSAFPPGISPSEEPHQLFVGSCRLVVFPRLRTHHLE